MNLQLTLLCSIYCGLHKPRLQSTVYRYPFATITNAILIDTLLSANVEGVNQGPDYLGVGLNAGLGPANVKISNSQLSFHL